MLLRRKIQISIISLVSIPLIILSVLVYHYTSEKLIEISENRILNISEIETENLNNIINSKKKNIELSSNVHEIVDVLEAEEKYNTSVEEFKSMEKANSVLKKTLKDSSELENIFVANLSGRIVLSGRKEELNLNIYNEWYFIDGLNSKTVISNIVLSKISKEKVIVMATPILDKKDKVIGVLLNTIKLDYFKEKIAKVKMGNQGYAYIVDGEGIVVAHPDEAKIGEHVENKVISDVVTKIKSKEKVVSGVGTYDYKGEEKYMAYGVISDINWIIIFTENKAQMNKTAIFLLILILATTLVFITIAIITSIKFSKSITRPINELIEAMGKAANGDLNSKCNFESNNEFGKLSRNFNLMLNKLNMNYEELLEVHEELSATEEELRGQYEDLQVHEEKIKYMAYYDVLTQLPNRNSFIKKLESELKKETSNGTVMFIDLDNFKNINDTFGHDYGDKLLEIVSEKFKNIIEAEDTVCRFGGDEFIILKPGIYETKEIMNFAQLVLNIFTEPLSIYEKSVFTTASIGISLYHKDGSDSSTILKNADTAMYAAKASGKNMYAFFDEKMHYSLERKIKIQSILRLALKNNCFELYYQPQIDIKNNKITGFEALIRLNYENMGFISPVEFIPIAEECGIIKEIGEWCLKTACLKNKEWRDKGYKFEYISVNISGVQFHKGNFIQIVTDILKETHCRPEFLEVEITETALMSSLEKNVKILECLRELGVKIALDDFGTGYSSFNYLRRLPINTLKIDKSFIDGICLSAKEEAIALGIIQLAHKMQLEVVAEGVESSIQFNLLKVQECDKIQGYLFSKPVPADAAEELLKQSNFNLG